MDLHDIQVAMAIGTFFIGIVTFSIGVFMLVRNSMGKDVRTIADQTAKLAQKGLAEEVAGLVGNASALLGAMTSMVHTTTGIGLFLTLIGLLMMLASYWLVLQIV